MTDNERCNICLKSVECLQNKDLHKIHLDHTNIVQNSLEEIHDYTLEDEIRLLQTKILELESRQSKLMRQMQKSNLDLEHERRKVTQLERQLEFAKSNQFIFKNLKDVNQKTKCNTAEETKIVEVRDKSVQTWTGVLCRACLDTEKLRSELEKTKGEYNDCILVKRNAMDKINETIQTLKGNV